jgi:hypothetical protein
MVYKFDVKSYSSYVNVPADFVVVSLISNGMVITHKFFTVMIGSKDEMCDILYAFFYLALRAPDNQI